MTWLFLDATSSFPNFAKEWDALNEVRTNHILLDSRFLSSLITHFGSKKTVLAVNGRGPAWGMALLVKTSAGLWSTFQPSQSPLGLILLGYVDEGYDRSIELFRSLPGHPVLLSILQQDPLHTSFSAVTNRENIEILNYIDTPRLALAGTFDQYWSQRGKNLRHNLERQTRRLKEQNKTLELVIRKRPQEMADCVRRYAQLESAGWKAKGNTAISEDNDQGLFYRDVFQTFASTGEAVVFQLRIDDTVVATDLCLYRNGMLVVLKTTYDETLDRLSPALLMRREIMQELYNANQVRVVEFYGRVREWHTQWSSDVRSMFHINVFRNGNVAKIRRLWKQFQWAPIQT